MKQSRLLLYLSAVVLSLSSYSSLQAQQKQAEYVPQNQSLQVIRPTAEQLGSIYYAYPGPDKEETASPAPAGYRPFYISHYGRHGSRWMTADSRYSVVVSLFDSLNQVGQLTPLGEDVRRRLHVVWADARGKSGNITPLGERQHRDIARRMITSFPEVFRDSARIDARSSTSLRCALSMSYFTEALKEVNPRLQVSRRSYNKYMDYIAYTSPEGDAFSADTASWRREFAAFEARLVRPARLLASLFTRPAIFDAKRADELMRSLYWIAADMQNTDLAGRMSFYDLFTRDELFGLWQTVNARMYVCNGNAPLAHGVMIACARPLLRNIVEGAEAAIKEQAVVSSSSTGIPASSTVPAADLRFGHDTHLLRLLALMRIVGCDRAEADMDRFHLAWQDYQMAPMGGNLQLIFYRNAETEKVLVKLLLNEHEARLPIPSVDGCYYDWEAVKALWQASLG